MAASQVETVSSGADKAKLFAVAALVVAAVAGFYFLAKQGVYVQWGVLLVGLVAAAGVFLISEPGRQFVAFARDAWREVKKVVWPTRKETLQMTLMCLPSLSSWRFFCGLRTKPWNGFFTTSFWDGESHDN